jgi:MarR family transcriptional regulator, organic hydroperoxide resistance regulator
MTGNSALKHRISDEALELSKLLVEFINTTYAVRRRPEEGDEERPTISPHAIRAAIHIYQHGERTVGQLSSGLGISYGWASRVVDELEAAHYIVRERDDVDRRVVWVRLDPSSQAQVERASAWRGEAIERALEPFTPDERAAVKLFLRRVIDQIMEVGRETP